MNKKEDNVVFNLPDKNNIPCLRCKWGILNYLEIRCPKYPTCKPKEVYFENAPCEKFEPIK